MGGKKPISTQILRGKGGWDEMPWERGLRKLSEFRQVVLSNSKSERVWDD
jgi:hypothetical protein